MVRKIKIKIKRGTKTPKKVKIKITRKQPETP